MEKLYTYQEVANYLQVTPQTVRKWVKKGLLQKTTFGKAIRFKQSDIKLFIEKGER